MSTAGKQKGRGQSEVYCTASTEAWRGREGEVMENQNAQMPRPAGDVAKYNG